MKYLSSYKLSELPSFNWNVIFNSNKKQYEKQFWTRPTLLFNLQLTIFIITAFWKLEFSTCLRNPIGKFLEFWAESCRALDDTFLQYHQRLVYGFFNLLSQNSAATFHPI